MKTLTTEHIELIDDLLSEFDGSEGPFMIGPLTQAALNRMWEVNEDLMSQIDHMTREDKETLT